MQSSRYHFWADISVVDSFQLIARMKDEKQHNDDQRAS